MNLDLKANTPKKTVFDMVGKYLKELSLNFSNIDDARPWGGFFVIDETQTDDFIRIFFPGLERNQAGQSGQRLSPKILLVEPGKRLSWQYHNRRAELWRVVAGPVGIITSSDNQQGAIKELPTGETVQFAQGVRHRLIGLNNWGVVAEIWQHTDPQSPSDESDIVRVEDDFGR
jgi:mannose-6-phosphate isomerase